MEGDSDAGSSAAGEDEVEGSHELVAVDLDFAFVGECLSDAHASHASSRPVVLCGRGGQLFCLGCLRAELLAPSPASWKAALAAELVRLLAALAPRGGAVGAALCGAHGSPGGAEDEEADVLSAVLRAAAAGPEPRGGAAALGEALPRLAAACVAAQEPGDASALRRLAAAAATAAAGPGGPRLLALAAEALGSAPEQEMLLLRSAEGEAIVAAAAALLRATEPGDATEEGVLGAGLRAAAGLLACAAEHRPELLAPLLPALAAPAAQHFQAARPGGPLAAELLGFYSLCAVDGDLLERAALGGEEGGVLQGLALAARAHLLQPSRVVQQGALELLEALRSLPRSPPSPGSLEEPQASGPAPCFGEWLLEVVRAPGTCPTVRGQAVGALRRLAVDEASWAAQGRDAVPLIVGVIAEGLTREEQGGAAAWLAPLVEAALVLSERVLGRADGAGGAACGAGAGVGTSQLVPLLRLAAAAVAGEAVADPEADAAARSPQALLPPPLQLAGRLLGQEAPPRPCSPAACADAARELRRVAEALAGACGRAGAAPCAEAACWALAGLWRRLCRPQDAWQAHVPSAVSDPAGAAEGWWDALAQMLECACALAGCLSQLHSSPGAAAALAAAAAGPLWGAVEPPPQFAAAAATPGTAVAVAAWRSAASALAPWVASMATDGSAGRGTADEGASEHWPRALAALAAPALLASGGPADLLSAGRTVLLVPAQVLHTTVGRLLEAASLAHGLRELLDGASAGSALCAAAVAHAALGERAGGNGGDLGESSREVFSRALEDAIVSKEGLPAAMPARAVLLLASAVGHRVERGDSGARGRWDGVRERLCEGLAPALGRVTQAEWSAWGGEALAPIVASGLRWLLAGRTAAPGGLEELRPQALGCWEAAVAQLVPSWSQLAYSLSGGPGCAALLAAAPSTEWLVEALLRCLSDARAHEALGPLALLSSLADGDPSCPAMLARLGAGAAVARCLQRLSTCEQGDAAAPDARAFHLGARLVATASAELEGGSAREMLELVIQAVDLGGASLCREAATGTAHLVRALAALALRGQGGAALRALSAAPWLRGAVGASLRQPLAQGADESGGGVAEASFLLVTAVLLADEAASEKGSQGGVSHLLAEVGAGAWLAALGPRASGRLRACSSLALAAWLWLGVGGGAACEAAWPIPPLPSLLLVAASSLEESSLEGGQEASCVRDASSLLSLAALSARQFPLRSRVYWLNVLSWRRPVAEQLLRPRGPTEDASTAVLLLLGLLVRSRPLWLRVDRTLAPVAALATEVRPSGPRALAQLHLAKALVSAADAAPRSGRGPAASCGWDVASHESLAALAADVALWRSARAEVVAAASALPPRGALPGAGAATWRDGSATTWAIARAAAHRLEGALAAAAAEDMLPAKRPRDEGDAQPAALWGGA